MIDPVLNALVESSDLPALALDRHRRIEKINLAASERLSLAADQVAGHPIQQIINRSDHAAFRDWPFYDAKGEIDGYLVVLTAVARDSADRTPIERDDDVGRLASGIAHDFDNVLAIVSGHLQMTEMGAADAAVRDHIRQAQLACDMGIRMTRRLRSYARARHHQPSIIDVNAMITSLVPAITGALSEVIQLDRVLEPDLPLAYADPAGLESAILNLLLNAMDATADGGTITVSTRRSPEGRVAITVKDTGSGMAPHVAARAFEPYFTTKPPDHGMGLGLATVKGFMRQAGGSVSLNTGLGAGTEVTLFLPPAANRRISR